MKNGRNRLVTAVLLLSAASGGCASTQAAGEEDEGRMSAASFSDETVARDRADDFWRLDEDASLDPSDIPEGPRKMAIAELSVEFVSGGATDPVAWSRSVKTHAPESLRSVFAEVAAGFDRIALPTEDVIATAAYQRLRGADVGDIIAADDAGEAPTWWPASGLLVLESEQEAGALAALLAETGADAVLQVKLRVGIDGGRATFEPGSQLIVTTPGGKAVFVSKLALVAERRIVTADEIEGGKLPAVDSTLLLLSVERLFRLYISMALVAAGIG